MGDALQQDFCIGVLAHKSTVDQRIISRSSDEAFVLYLVLKAGTVYEILDEGVRQSSLLVVDVAFWTSSASLFALSTTSPPTLGLSMSWTKNALRNLGSG